MRFVSVFINSNSFATDAPPALFEQFMEQWACATSGRHVVFSVFNYSAVSEPD